MTTETATPRVDVTADWRPRFLTIWVGQAVSLIGNQLVQFALIWYLTQRTGSATTLALASLAGLLPSVLLSPLIGTYVDRGNRRLIMILSDAGIALATLALAGLFAWRKVEVWEIYSLLFVRAVGGGFQSSALGASTVLLVPKEQLTRVQGLNQILNGGLGIFSAPLGALLLGVMPMQVLLAIDLATAAASVGPLLYFSVPQPTRAEGTGERSSALDDLREGVRYVWTWPGLMMVLMMAAFLNFLLTPTMALLPLLVTKHFNGGAMQLGWLESALSLGVIGGGLALTTWGGFRRRMLTGLLGLVVMGGGICLTGASPAAALWLAVAGMAVMGIMNTIVNGSMGAILQAAVAPEMQGRVFALVMTLATGVAPIGLAIAGPLADKVGIQAWFWAGGLACVAMGLAGFAIRPVYYLEDHRRAQPQTVEVE